MPLVGPCAYRARMCAGASSRARPSSDTGRKMDRAAVNCRHQGAGDCGANRVLFDWPRSRFVRGSGAERASPAPFAAFRRCAAHGGPASDAAPCVRHRQVRFRIAPHVFSHTAQGRAMTGQGRRCERRKIPHDREVFCDVCDRGNVPSPAGDARTGGGERREENTCARRRLSPRERAGVQGLETRTDGASNPWERSRILGIGNVGVRMIGTWNILCG